MLVFIKMKNIEQKKMDRMKKIIHISTQSYEMTIMKENGEKVESKALL